MRKPYIIIIVSALAGILSIPLWFDVATSVVPGWHTIILPPAFIAAIIVYLVIIMVAVAWIRIYQITRNINRKYFITHLLLTLPAIILTMFPSLFLNLQTTDLDKLQQQVILTMRLMSSAYILFIAGQVVFTIYFIKVLTQKNNGTLSIHQ